MITIKGVIGGWIITQEDPLTSHKTEFVAGTVNELISVIHECCSSVPANTVRTRGGFRWKRISSGPGARYHWLDETSGLTWGPEEPGTFTHDEAVKKFGTKLPTKEEFEEAEKHGIREVIDMKDKWFWSASVHPNYDFIAHYFNGYVGYFGYVSRDSNDVSVRCVGGR